MAHPHQLIHGSAVHLFGNDNYESNAARFTWTGHGIDIPVIPFLFGIRNLQLAIHAAGQNIDALAEKGIINEWACLPFVVDW